MINDLEREGGVMARRRLVWVLALGTFDFSLEQSMLTPVLPAILREYDASPTSVTWLLSGFLVAAAVAMPLGGRLGDRYGRRRVLLWSLGAYVLGSIVCVVADDIDVLIAGRVIQGLGAGVSPLAVALIRDHVQIADLPKVIGFLVGAGGLGGVMGLLLAGLLVQHVSIDSIFWCLAAVASGLAVAVRLTVPETPVRARQTIDWMGAGLLGSALVVLMVAITWGNSWGWGSGRIVGLFGASCLLLAGFALRERAAAEPLVALPTLQRRPVWAANLAAFSVGFSFFISFAIMSLVGGLPEATGYGLGLSTVGVALMLTPSAVAAIVGGVLGGRLVKRIGARNQALLGILGASLTYACLLAARDTAESVAAGLVPLGLGIGLSLGAIADLVVLSCSREETGVAIGLNSVIRSIGAALGPQVAIAVVVAAPELAPRVPAPDGFTDALRLGLVATLVAMSAVSLIPKRAEDPVFAAPIEASQP
jgi:MFS family permease